MQKKRIIASFLKQIELGLAALSDAKGYFVKTDQAR